VARDPCSGIAARLQQFMRSAKLPLLLVIIAILSALTKIGINSFTGLFWHFRREITTYLISRVGNWLAVLYWIAHGVALLCRRRLLDFQIWLAGDRLWYTPACYIYNQLLHF
jgi:hypothetical protein